MRHDLDKEFTPGRLMFLLGLLMLALFPEIVLGSHAFFYRDAGLFTYPVAYYFRDCFWRGEIPLWNPYSICGTPFLAQWNTMVLYPLNIIYLLLPMPWGLNFFLLGHIFLAGLGMYFLAHRWFNCRFAASVAGLVFAWNGLTLHLLLSSPNLAALAWMPWVILLCDRAGGIGGKDLAKAALAGACQMLAGAPEIVLFTWLIILVRTTVELRPAQGSFLTGLRRMSLVALLVAGMSAAQLMPWADLVQHGDRSSTYDSGAWSMPSWGVANFLVPLFRSTQSVTGVFTQPEQEWTSSYYIGIIALLLAAVGLLRGRSRTTNWLGAATLAGILCAMGNNGLLLNGIKAVFPTVGFMRYPVKFVCVPVFTLPLLAAAGLSWMWPAPAEKVRRILLSVSGLFFLGIVCLSFIAFRWPFAEEGWRNTLWSGVSRVLFLLTAAGLLLDQPKKRGRKMKAVLSFGLLVLIGLDVSSHMPRQNPVVITRGYEPYRLAMSTHPVLGDSRAMISREVDTLMGSLFHPYPLNMYLGQRAVLLENCNLLDQIPKVDGFFSLHLREQQDVHQLLYGAAAPEPLLDFLGVSEVAPIDPLFHWKSRSHHMKMASIGQQPVFTNGTNSLRLIGAADFHPQQEVFLPEGASATVSAQADPTAKILSMKTQPEESSFVTRSATQTMFTVAQTYDHNWKADIDGTPTKIWRANHAFQAVEVPAGRHELRMAYRPESFRLGVMISIGTLLATIILFFSCRASASRIELQRSLKVRSSPALGTL